MSAKSLYSILGIAKDASPADITKAYRLLALKYHPDKAHGDDKAKKMFHEIQNAYDVLKDPAQRRIYDVTGNADAVKGPLTVPVIDPADIEELSRSYPGSQDEKDDLKQFFRSNGGDVMKLFEYIPFTEPNATTAQRLLDLIVAMIDSGEINSREMKKEIQKFEGTRSKLLKKLPTLTRKHNAEKREFAKEYGDASFAELAAQISENRRRRAQEAERVFLAIDSSSRSRSSWQGGSKVVRSKSKGGSAAKHPTAADD